MSKWIKLIETKPPKEDTYKVLKFSEWGKRWSVDNLRWGKYGYFYSIGYDMGHEFFIETDVAFWLETEEPAPPIEDAESLIIETEVFFENGDDLREFCHDNGIIPFAVYGNASEIITSGLSESLLNNIRLRFKSQMKHKHIRKS
jgi:hypothetical protein